MRLAARIRRLTGAVTPRGRALAAGGAACLAAAQSLGEPDLLRVAVLLLTLPALSLGLALRARHRLRLTRSVAPARVEPGSAAVVTLRLENLSWLPSQRLILQDTLPAQLEGQARFGVDPLPPAAAREFSYPVRGRWRGRYPLGPLTVRITDPFGCVELARAFSGRDLLTVTPQIHRLPPAALAGDWLGGGDAGAAAVAVTGEADVATREYRQGDDLRKVHWRSTAKRGQLMVRRDEQPRQNRASLLLDTRRSAYPGSGRDGGFEWAVSALASVGVWLTRRGYGVQLATSSGLRVGAASPSVAEDLLLDALSVVQLGVERALDAALDVVAARGGLVIAAVGICDPATVRALAAVPARATSALVLLADRGDRPSGAGAGPPGGAARPGAAALLRAAGWRVLPAHPRAGLAEAWARASAGRDAFAGGPAAP